MIKLFYILIIFSIILFFSALYRAYKGEVNFLSAIFKNFSSFSNKKKVIFFISFLSFTIPYSFLVINRFFYLFFIIICSFFGLFLRIDIKRKIKKWNYLNYTYDNSIKFKELILIIFKDSKVNQYNRSYFTIYFFIKKEKKKYLEIFETMGFYNFMGFSRNYVENIIYFVSILDDSEINKRSLIKIKIIFRRIMHAILCTVNQNFLMESIINDSMKIKIENFKISVNGNIGSSSKFKLNHLFVNNNFKILGQETDKSKLRGNKHLVIRVFDQDGVLTSSSLIRCDNSKNREKIKCIETGIQDNGKKQYVLPIERKEDYNLRYNLNEMLDRKIIEGFNLKDKDVYTGRIIKDGIGLASQEKKEIMLKGVKTDKKEGNFSAKVFLSEEEKKSLTNASYKEVGQFVRKNLEDSDRFQLEKDQKNLIKNSERNNGYYDEN